MDFDQLLQGKLLIGMCHLPSVSKGIGSWYYSAERNIEALASGGIKAVILENDGDKDIVANPRYSPSASRLQTVENYMMEVGSRIRKRYPELAIGYQILWNYWGSIKIAEETAGDFIRSQLYWEQRATPKGLVLEPTFQAISDFRKKKNLDIAVLADIDSKGTLPVGDYSREKSIESLVTSQFKPDALVFTGNGATGERPTPDGIVDFYNDVRKYSSVPVGGGRDLALDNVGMFTDTPASFWIAGQSLKDNSGYNNRRNVMELMSLVGK